MSEIEVNVVRHGSGPAARWAEGARPGDQLAEVVGPRGKITVNQEAPWHLFAGDETAIPAVFNLVEALPQGARATVILEVQGRDDQMQFSPQAAVDLRWLHRGSAAPGGGDRLLPALDRVPLPAGPGQGYLAGEARTVLAMRDLLVARAMPRDRLAVKAYWRADLPNLDRGEPEPAE